MKKVIRVKKHRSQHHDKADGKEVGSDGVGTDNVESSGDYSTSEEGGYEPSGSGAGGDYESDGV